MEDLACACLRKDFHCSRHLSHYRVHPYVDRKGRPRLNVLRRQGIAQEEDLRKNSSAVASRSPESAPEAPPDSSSTTRVRSETQGHSAGVSARACAVGSLPMQQPVLRPEQLLTLHAWVLGVLRYAQTAHIALAAAVQHARRSAAVAQRAVSSGSASSSTDTDQGLSQSTTQLSSIASTHPDPKVRAVLARAASTREQLHRTLAAVRVCLRDRPSPAKCHAHSIPGGAEVPMWVQAAMATVHSQDSMLQNDTATRTVKLQAAAQVLQVWTAPA